MWNWFQNRRYALRAKAAKAPEKLSVSPVPPRDDPTTVRNVPQAPQHLSVPPGTVESSGSYTLFGGLVPYGSGVILTSNFVS